MTNRKLKKKIRQAFEHATPDLAESIAIDSLLSDAPLKKESEKPIKPTKPIKTPIQFRAIATLAASIAVVALLAGLISHTNPFVPSNHHDEVYGQSQTDTTPPDVSGFDPDVLNEELDWNKLYLRYFDQYFDIDYVYHHEVIQVGGRTCLVMAADYGHIGKYILVDAQTEQVRNEKEILGSNNAINLYRVKAGSEIDPNTVNWNLEFYKNTICYRLVNSGTTIKGLIMDAQSGQVVENYVFGGVIPETDPTEGQSDDISNQLYITNDYAINVALTHAGLTKDDLSHGTVTHIPNKEEHRKLTVSFSTADYEYEYEFSRTDGSILSASKEYRHELTPITPSTPIIDKNEAIRIAFADPMVSDLATLIRVTKTSDDGNVFYNVYLNELDIQYEVEVSCAEGIVLDLEIERQEILHGDDEHYEHDGTTPPDGKIGDENAIDAALRYAGLTIHEVGSAHCEEDTDDETPHYDVEFIYMGYEYKYEIGMYNAQLVSIEKEQIY